MLRAVRLFKDCLRVKMAVADDTSVLNRLSSSPLQHSRTTVRVFMFIVFETTIARTFIVTL